MTSSRRCTAVALFMVGAMLTLGAPVAARDVEPRFGAVVGMGFATTRAPGAFRWNLDAPGDSALAVVRIGASAARWRGFVSMAAVRGVGAEADAPRFTWREAALGASWQARADSAAVVLFAHQPDRTWLDLPLVQMITPERVGRGAASGVRADATWRRTGASVLWVAGRGHDAATTAVPRAADPAALLVRWRAGVPGSVRGGLTWARDLPDAGAAARDDARWRDATGVDFSAQRHGVWAAVQYTQTHAAFAASSSARVLERGARGWRWEHSRRLTDMLPERAALWAELRAPSIGAGRWFRLGCAPSYRALGARFVQRLQDPERDPNAPVRGLEGPRLETWLVARSWPAWVRQVFERHTEFGDADRKVLTQSTEAQAWITSRLRARAWYVQRRMRDNAHRERAHHDDLVGEIVAEDRAGRVRLQSGWVDLHTPTERGVVALESTAPVAGRLHLVSRLAAVSTGPAARRSAYVGLQYWHLPEFELVLEYGTARVADGTEPALDTDLTAAGAQEDRIRLHFRGWF